MLHNKNAGNRVYDQYNAFGDLTRHQGFTYGYDAQGQIGRAHV